MRRIQHIVWLLVGCGNPTPAANPAPDPPPLTATEFDPALCGEVVGRVTWQPAVPEFPPFHHSVAKDGGSFEMKPIPNPNALAVDPATKGVGGAVVWLNGIDTVRAKSWNLPGVTVEFRDMQIGVRQGDGAAKRVGLVKRGDAVRMVSAESQLHILRGRGAAYFSLAFPDPNKELTRAFDKPGRVELSSGAGYHWAHADLFVCEHPYFALTDREGRFRFEQVPAGPVSVVAWHPNWLAAKQERDPETGLVSRTSYAAPLEVKTSASVTVAGTSSADIRLK